MYNWTEEIGKWRERHSNQVVTYARTQGHETAWYVEEIGPAPTGANKTQGKCGI